MSHGEMLEYFSHESFLKLFLEAGKKYRSLGKVGGVVKLSGLSPEDLDRLSGFLGRDCQGVETLAVKVSEINDILKQSRFVMDLPDFLEVYLGREIMPNKETAIAESKKWNSCCF